MHEVDTQVAYPTITLPGGSAEKSHSDPINLVSWNPAIDTHDL